MAKQDLSRHQEKIVKRYYDNLDTITLNKLGEMVSDLYLCEDDTKAGKMWDRVAAALGKTDMPPERVADIVEARDIKRLANLVTELQGNRGRASGPAGNTDRPGPATPTPKAVPPPPRTTPPPVVSSDEVTPEVLKKAMKAFRKKLKSYRLDQESKLGYGATTSGRQSSVVAIQPPQQYPAPVWDELVKQGRLRKSGRNLYELTDA